MDSKVCIVCNIEKSFDNFYNKYRECKQCNIETSTRRYYENKDKISNQHKTYYEKNRDVLLAKFKKNQQKRKYEIKTYEQQIKDLNKKIEDLTQAFGMLKYV